MIEDALLGFDARLEPATGFRIDRPVEFLLRTDLDDVLSADTMVWPSLFTPVVSLAGPQPPLLPRPQYIGINPPFWEDLSGLRSALAEGEAPHHSYREIAATWHTNIGFAAEGRLPGKIFGPYLAAVNPTTLDAAWQFVGYDITDGGFISGLTNCGYTSAERELLSHQWSRHLNPYHLLEDLDRAFQFRTLTNARVVEHAPFFVVGLWILRPVPL